MENVPDIDSSPIFHDALKYIRSHGYKINYKVLKASHFGVAQRRRRLFVIGLRPDIAEQLGVKDEKDILDIFPKESSYEPTVKDALDNLEIDKRERSLVTSALRKSSVYEIMIALDKNPKTPTKLEHLHEEFKGMYFNVYRSAWNSPSPTITSLGNRLGGRGGIIHPVEDRTFTIKELMRLSSLPDVFVFTGNFNDKVERIGNMVPPYLTKEISNAIYQKVLLPIRVSHEKHMKRTV